MTSSIRLRILGSGDAFAGGGRFQAALYLEGAEEPLLLDCGASTLIALKRAQLDPSAIGAIALSHLHGDHFGGIPWMVLDGQFAERAKPLVIAGPPGTEQRLGEAGDALYPGFSGRERPFDLRIVEYDGRAPVSLGEASVTPFEAHHESGAPAYALRVSYGGKTVAYSGDTEWTDGLLELARGADLFVCECNNFDESVPGHIDYRTLLAKREQLDCSRLVITHMSDTVLANLSSIEFEPAEDGMVIEL